MYRTRIDRATGQALTQSHAPVMVHCYVDPCILPRLAEGGELTVAEAFAELLPTMPHLQSGDFGEILCFAALQARDQALRFPLFRWRSRKSRNSTVMGVDLVGYMFAGATPSTADALILAEVKTRAKKSSKKRAAEVAKLAYDGVKKDYSTRLANQLLFQHKALLEEGKTLEASRIARFRNPHRAGARFRTRLVAAVVHEHALWTDEFLDTLPEEHGTDADEVELVLIEVDSLVQWVGEVNAAAALAAESCSDTCSGGCTPECGRPRRRPATESVPRNVLG